MHGTPLCHAAKHLTLLQCCRRLKICPGTPLIAQKASGADVTSMDFYCVFAGVRASLYRCALHKEQPWRKHSVLRRGAVTQWDTYFHQYEPVYTKVPVMMCPGCVHLQSGQDTFKHCAAYTIAGPCCTQQGCILAFVVACGEQWLAIRE